MIKIFLILIHFIIYQCSGINEYDAHMTVSNISFLPGSMDKNTCMTGRKDFVMKQVKKCVTYPLMFPPFDNLVIKKDKGSIGKCWVFF